jgi:hypothetical protein
MRTTRNIGICFLILFSWILHVRGEDVSTLSKRQETLDLAARLLAPQEAAVVPQSHDLMNPFSAQRRGADEQRTSRPVGTDREILEKIAATMQMPTGMMMFRGRPMLLFREKSLGVGARLKIPVDGVDYIVVITAIEPTSFRLGLNREEIARPIKPGNQNP